jgi:hypothetical protein
VAASPASGAVPGPLAEDGQHRRHQHHADHGRVQQQRHGHAHAHLLEHHQVPGGEAAEHDHDDQGGAGDDPGGGADPDHHRASGVAGLGVALVDAAEQEHLVVHGQPEQHREQEQRYPGLDRVDLLQAE